MTESVRRRPIGNERSKYFRGSVRDAVANFQAGEFENSRFIIRITTTITIHRTAATGSCCASTVTMMSILGIRLRNGMTKRRRPLGKSEPEGFAERQKALKGLHEYESKNLFMES
jgi:hypothetical protein